MSKSNFRKNLSSQTRKSALRRDGHRCQLCGFQAIPTSEGYKFPVIKVVLTVDHIVPIIFGGSNRTGNLQAACNICNTIKGRKEDYFPPPPEHIRKVIQFYKNGEINRSHKGKKTHSRPLNKYSNGFVPYVRPDGRDKFFLAIEARGYNDLIVDDPGENEYDE